jgi:hypothetical protein
VEPSAPDESLELVDVVVGSESDVLDESGDDADVSLDGALTGAVWSSPGEVVETVPPPPSAGGGGSDSAGVDPSPVETGSVITGAIGAALPSPPPGDETAGEVVDPLPRSIPGTVGD